MIHREREGSVTVLRMEHGKVQALDAELMEQLSEALDETLGETSAPDESAGEGGAGPARAVVLTGTGKAFSAGVDLFRVVEGGRDYVESFLPALTRGLLTLFTHPRPVVAAINGHAIAGGAILACACDARILADGDLRMGVPELEVGVPYPTLAMEVLRWAVPPQHLQRLVYGASTYGPDHAFNFGLVDEVVAADLILPRAVQVASAYGALDPQAFQLTKRTLRRPALERFENLAPSFDRQVVERWAAPETLEAIRGYLKRSVGGR